MQKLGTHDLEVGSALPWDVFDTGHQLLLKRGTLIERETQIEHLIERGMFVEDGVFEAWREAHPDVLDQARKTFDPFWTFEKIELRLSQVLHEPPTPEHSQAAIRKLATLIQQLTHRDADACLSVVMSMPTRRYAVAHMLHCAIVCELVGIRLQWSEARRLTCVCAALTMNVAMLDLQNVLFNQRGPLTNVQKEIVKLHPAQSVMWLLKAGVEDEDWLAAVGDHHENPKGTGYPTQHTEDLSPLAELLRLADIYCAKVTPRAYRPAIAPDRVARELFVEESTAEHPVAQLIIKEVGIYPPGTFVKLFNGETAMVVRRGENVATPNVLSLSSGQGVPFLRPMKRTTDKPEHAIVGVVPIEKVMVRIDRREIWGQR